VIYLWVFPAREYAFWPHYLLLSFYIFALLFVIAVLISLLDKKSVRPEPIDKKQLPPTSKKVWRVWIALIIVMISLYIIFNGF
jgi:SSS family solute:Na+ symporter